MIRAPSGISSPRQAVRVAGAVPALVVVENPVGDRLDAEALEHPVADLRVALEHHPLRLGERARLAQDLLRDRELAEVVQAGGEAGQLDLLVGEAEPARRSGRRGRRRAASGCRCRRRARRRPARGSRRRGSARRGRGRSRAASARASSITSGPVGADAVLAVLLRPVERAVGEPDQLVAVDARCGGDVATPALTVTGPTCSSFSAAIRSTIEPRRRGRVLVEPGRSSANSSPPSRKASPAWRRRAANCDEHAVARRMAEAVVDPLEVVDVDRQRLSGRRRSCASAAPAQAARGSAGGCRARSADRSARAASPAGRRRSRAGRAGSRAAGRRARPRGTASAARARPASARPRPSARTATIVQRMFVRASAKNERRELTATTAVIRIRLTCTGRRRRHQRAPARRLRLLRAAAPRRSGRRGGEREHRDVVGDPDRRPVLEQLGDRRRQEDDDQRRRPSRRGRSTRLRRRSESETPPVSTPSTGTGKRSASVEALRSAASPSSVARLVRRDANETAAAHATPRPATHTGTRTARSRGGGKARRVTLRGYQYRL